MSMTYYAVTDDPNELTHWGIKGMKWGVRHDKPRHTGSSRKRSAAYKKAQSKLSKMMKSGIKKAEAHWKAYNSPKAKEERFMKKAMQQARTGTLKYGKLTDDQVRRVTERLALERNARQLGSTENPKFVKRIKTALGEGIVRGVGQGTGAYIEERFRGRGRTTAEIKRDKRMAKYESDQQVQKRKARNKVNQEYYEEAERRGYEESGIARITQTQSDRAKQLRAWNDSNAKEAERTKRQNAYYDVYVRAAAANRAKTRVPDKSSSSSNNSGNSQQNNNNGPGKSQSPIVININGHGYSARRTTKLPGGHSITGVGPNMVPIYGPNGQIIGGRRKPKTSGRTKGRR